MGTVRKQGMAPVTQPPRGQARAPVAAAAARPGPASGDVVIDVQGLGKTYADGTRAVHGARFQVRRGEVFGLLGPNGAGKTTIMRILGTLHPATEGTATVLGLDVARRGPEVRERIGFAMQEVGLDDLATAEEMLLLHARIYGIARDEAARRAGDLLRLFELEGHKDRRVVRFSGGMKRRLDLAVSIIHEPELLILDEPSTGLDPKSRADLWGTLRRLRREKGLTILMSTHYMDEADALCDRIAMMSAGRIAAIDTAENLKRSVGRDVLRVRLGAPASHAQQAALEQRFGAGSVRLSDGTLDLLVDDGASALVPSLRALTDLGLQVQSTRVMTPTLDDVFLKYTGQHLAEEGEA